jgi:hypothetical protein
MQKKNRFFIQKEMPYTGTHNIISISSRDREYKNIHIFVVLCSQNHKIKWFVSSPFVNILISGMTNIFPVTFLTKSFLFFCIIILIKSRSYRQTLYDFYFILIFHCFDNIAFRRKTKIWNLN